MAVPRSTEALVVGRLRIRTLASGGRAVQGPVVALRIPVSRAVGAAMLAAMGIERVLVRLAELLAALSVATDLRMGQPGDHAARTCLLAVRLARELSLSDDQVSDVFYVALLRYLGGTADASEVAAFAGDEIALAVAVAPFVMGETRDEDTAVAIPDVQRAKATAIATHCEAAELLAGPPRLWQAGIEVAATRVRALGRARAPGRSGGRGDPGGRADRGARPRRRTVAARHLTGPDARDDIPPPRPCLRPDGRQRFGCGACGVGR